MTEYLCWSCGKKAKPHTKHDSNTTVVHYLADCCSDNSYAQLEDNYPQPVQMELL